MKHETWGESSWNLGAWIGMPLCWFVSWWWMGQVYGSPILLTTELFRSFVIKTKLDFQLWNLVGLYDVCQHFPYITFEFFQSWIQVMLECLLAMWLDLQLQDSQHCLHLGCQTWDVSHDLQKMVFVALLNASCCCKKFFP